MTTPRFIGAHHLGVAATARASLYVYNDEADVDALADAIQAAGEFFAF